jgi:hypothetical protein
MVSFNVSIDHSVESYFIRLHVEFQNLILGLKNFIQLTIDLVITFDIINLESESFKHSIEGDDIWFDLG